MNVKYQLSSFPGPLLILPHIIYTSHITIIIIIFVSIYIPGSE